MEAKNQTSTEADNRIVVFRACEGSGEGKGRHNRQWTQ